MYSSCAATLSITGGCPIIPPEVRVTNVDSCVFVSVCVSVQHVVALGVSVVGRFVAPWK